MTVLGVRPARSRAWAAQPEGSTCSDHRKYRKFTSKQKVGELVLASFRGDRSIAELWVAALVTRKLDEAVNRKRVLRVIR